MEKENCIAALNRFKELNPWKYVTSRNLVSVKCLNYAGYANLYGDEEYQVVVIYPGEDGYNDFCFDSTSLPCEGSEVEERLSTIYLIAFHNDEVMISYSEEGMQETVELSCDQYLKIANFVETLTKGFKKYSQDPLPLEPKEKELEIIKKADDDVVLKYYEYDGHSIYKNYGFTHLDKLNSCNIFEDKEYEFSIGVIDFALEIDGINRPVFVGLIRDIETNAIIFGKGAYYDEEHNAINLIFNEVKQFALENGFARTCYTSDKAAKTLIACAFDRLVKNETKDITNDMRKDMLVVNQKIRYILPKFENNVATLDTLVWPFKGKKVN